MNPKNSILLEAGTNEVELLVFSVEKEQFGVNVAKVREIVQVDRIREMPMSHPTVQGTFILRNHVHLLLNLKRALGLIDDSYSLPHLVLVVEINNKTLGLMVDFVDSIHRMGWNAIEPVPGLLTNHRAPLTGIAHVNDEVVQILDLETVITEVTGETVHTFTESDPAEKRIESNLDKSNIRVLLAEDSAMIRKAVENCLDNAGYTQLRSTENGAQAWEILERVKRGEDQPYDILVTDVEMPGMDGLHLVSKLKKDPDLMGMLALIYSSIVSSENEKKGLAVGADAQISKFDSTLLLSTMEKLLGKKHSTSATAS